MYDFLSTIYDEKHLVSHGIIYTDTTPSWYYLYRYDWGYKWVSYDITCIEYVTFPPGPLSSSIANTCPTVVPIAAF